MFYAEEKDEAEEEDKGTGEVPSPSVFFGPLLLEVTEVCDKSWLTIQDDNFE